MDPAEIFSIDKDKFRDLALKIYRDQRINCAVYREWCELLGSGKEIYSFEQIPFLPIGLFKNRLVQNGTYEPEAVFSSSGTTGNAVSRHPVRELSFYKQSYLNGFRQFYGEPSTYCILALLPSYREREDSSLIYMVEGLIQKGAAGSGSLLHEPEVVLARIAQNERDGIKTLLIGVSYALLDLAEFAQSRPALPELKHTIIMETGGMKGRREELPKVELHRRLLQAFPVGHIHSEFGMTEMLSQAYSQKANNFFPANTLNIIIQDAGDPGKFLETGRRGRICIMDLANIHSCSFIATDDLGLMHADESFEVIGRLDFSDTRGCNLLIP